jgi:hypothetical protein
MAKSIQKEVGMQEINHELPFTPSSNDAVNEGKSLSLNDPDIMVSITVLLLACLSLAVLAHAVI